MKTAKKPEPFRHTPRELAVLNRAHSSMMEHLRAGYRYDVVAKAWVKGEVTTERKA